MSPTIYHHTKPITLECGATLPKVEIAYHTYGHMNASRDNIIWVCHALTANSEVADWWPHTVEEGRFLDPTKWFVVCANVLGSCYGTTGPASTDPRTGRPYYSRFPNVTVRDMVHCHQLLAEHLGITHVRLLIGASIGGYQAIEWAATDPEWADQFAFLFTAPAVTPWIAAFNESQRMAIEVDPTYGEDTETAGRDGMAVARSIGLLSYRGGSGYNISQRDENENVNENDNANVNADENEDVQKRLFGHRVQSYQRYQGEKLKRRYDCYAYVRMCNAVDSHNIARGRGKMEEVLRRINKPTLLMACTTDLIFPPDEQAIMRDNIPHNTFRLIDSPFGHDGFLVEYEQLDTIIQEFMSKVNVNANVVIQHPI